MVRKQLLADFTFRRKVLQRLHVDPEGYVAQNRSLLIPEIGPGSMDCKTRIRGDEKRFLKKERERYEGLSSPRRQPDPSIPWQRMFSPGESCLASVTSCH